MRRLIIAAALALSVFISGTIPSDAIQWGREDGDAHPYVVNVVVDLDGAPAYTCTATFLTQVWLVTAAHCMSAPAGQAVTGVRVYPENPSDVDAGYPEAGGWAALPIAHPGYIEGSLAQPFTNGDVHDVGLLRLLEGYWPGPFADLAAPGALETLRSEKRSERAVQIVGFGFRELLPNPNDFVFEPVRYAADPIVTTVKSATTRGTGTVQLSSNPVTGGTCYGDSGGPALLPGTNAVAAVGSYTHNPNCGGSALYYRLDRSEVLIWILTVLITVG